MVRELTFACGNYDRTHPLIAIPIFPSHRYPIRSHQASIRALGTSRHIISSSSPRVLTRMLTERNSAPARQRIALRWATKPRRTTSRVRRTRACSYGRVKGGGKAPVRASSTNTLASARSFLRRVSAINRTRRGSTTTTSAPTLLSCPTAQTIMVEASTTTISLRRTRGPSHSLKQRA